MIVNNSRPSLERAENFLETKRANTLTLGGSDGAEMRDFTGKLHMKMREFNGNTYVSRGGMLLFVYRTLLRSGKRESSHA